LAEFFSRFFVFCPQGLLENGIAFILTQETCVFANVKTIATSFRVKSFLSCLSQTPLALGVMKKLYVMKAFSVILSASLATIAVGLIIHRSVSDTSEQSPVAEVANVPSKAEGRSPSLLSHRSSGKSHSEWKNVEAADPADALKVQLWKTAAMKRVEKLDQKLKLNSAQQQRILEQMMAYSAPAGIALRIGDRTVDVAGLSHSGLTLEDAIADLLDPERASIYQQSLMEDAAWWDHAIEQMESSISDESESADEILIEDA
jgi:hypothetical protein